MKTTFLIILMLISISCQEEKEKKIKELHNEINENLKNNEKIDQLINDFKELDSDIERDTNKIYKIDEKEGLIEDKANR